MQISANQLDGRPRQVGTYESRPVMLVRTKGGFHMLVSPRPGKPPETLGTGPHQAVACAIAMKNFKNIEWTSLTKGDWIDPIFYEFLMPRYEEITKKFREVQGDK